MAQLEGDIDLTQNLDFYRKKPKKLLPANVNLRGRNDDEDKSNFITTRTGSISVSNTTYIRWNYIDTDESDGRLYLTTENQDTVTATTIVAQTNSTNLNLRRYRHDDSIDTISYSTSSSNNIVTTVRYTSYDDQWIISNNLDDMDEIITEDIDDSIKTVKYKLNNRFGVKNANRDISKCGGLWYEKAKQFVVNALEVKRCYDCDSLYLSLRGTSRCRKCQQKSDAKDREDLWCRHSYKGFEFNHLDHEPCFDYYDDIPWDNYYSRGRRKLCDNHNESRRYGIPWFQDLNYRIYDDYIEELLEGEKDYSSYLTNMSWIGIPRNINTEEDERRTTLILPNPDGDGDIVVHDDEVHPITTREINTIAIRRRLLDFQSQNWTNLEDMDTIISAI